MSQYEQYVKEVEDIASRVSWKNMKVYGQSISREDGKRIYELCDVFPKELKGMTTFEQMRYRTAIETIFEFGR